MDWRSAPGDWSEDAVRALLSLAGEFRVTDAKGKLQALVGSSAFTKLLPVLRPAILRTIATMSTNVDAAFWSGLAPKQPEFAGIAFQVLTRIAPRDAILLLGRLPTNDSAVQGVARKLPDFVSQHEGDQQIALLAQIADAFKKLPAESIIALNSALKAEGFDVGDVESGPSEQHWAAFRIIAMDFAKTLQPANTLSPVYARAS